MVLAPGWRATHPRGGSLARPYTVYSISPLSPLVSVVYRYIYLHFYIFFRREKHTTGTAHAGELIAARGRSRGAAGATDSGGPTRERAPPLVRAAPALGAAGRVAQREAERNKPACNGGGAADHSVRHT